MLPTVIKSLVGNGFLNQGVIFVLMVILTGRVIKTKAKAKDREYEQYIIYVRKTDKQLLEGLVGKEVIMEIKTKRF